jgi:hypothetical protein
MAKTTDQLSDRNCRTASTGKHHDGMGLYLSCRAGTARVTKSWLFRYKLNGKAAWMGGGRVPAVHDPDGHPIRGGDRRAVV